MLSLGSCDNQGWKGKEVQDCQIEGLDIILKAEGSLEGGLYCSYYI